MSENSLPEGATLLAVDGQPVSTAASVPLDSGAKPVYVAPGPIETTLPDGRTIRMEEPKRSLSKTLAAIMSEFEFKSVALGELERQRVRSLLYITHIDNRQITAVVDPISRAALEQQIGDRFLDEIFLEWRGHFGNDIPLQTVKK